MANMILTLAVCLSVALLSGCTDHMQSPPVCNKFSQPEYQTSVNTQDDLGKLLFILNQTGWTKIEIKHWPQLGWLQSESWDIYAQCQKSVATNLGEDFR